MPILQVGLDVQKHLNMAPSEIRKTIIHLAAKELKVLIGFAIVGPLSVSLMESRALASSPPSWSSLSVQLVSR